MVRRSIAGWVVVRHVRAKTIAGFGTSQTNVQVVFVYGIIVSLAFGWSHKNVWERVQVVLVLMEREWPYIQGAPSLPQRLLEGVALPRARVTSKYCCRRTKE